MVNYARAGRSRGKLWWRPAADTDVQIVRPTGYRGERLIEPSSSWFPPKFPSDSRSSGASSIWVGRHGRFAEPCQGIESSKWAIFGKQNRRCGMNRKSGYGAQLRANLEPTKGVGRLRQQTVVMEVEIR
ncbi:hypothetical protein Syun_031893 [Stephania yunnanensis]|uniref:Uncharacterized protein n=1 Tax=Stephania yunnanensis TaxID=152371 RepID=A0AAP0DYC7_9MAGN